MAQLVGRRGGQSSSASHKRIRSRLTFRQKFRRDRVMLLLVLPGLLYFIIFHYVAMVGNVTAFLDYQPYLGFLDSPFVGLENFRAMIQDPEFWNAVNNTIVIFLLQLLLFFPAPILLALLLNSILSTRTRRLIQSIVYLPHFISWVIIVILFEEVLGSTGLVGRTWLFAQDHGLLAGTRPPNITGNPDTFPLLITAQTIWREAGWGTIIYLAALVGIDQTLYEAAAVDGARRWQRLLHVTLPGIVDITIVLLILRLGMLLSVGFEPVLLQRNAVGAGAAEVLDTYVYFNGVAAGQWGVSAAAGLMKGVIGTLLVLGSNRVAHMLGSGGLYK
jgi:putative aldouronate transport system permease protein